MARTFLYFSYGSNLLAQRIHINNPSAIRAGIAKLEDYRLDFVTYSVNWKGAAATIVPSKGSYVWGALWEIDNIHLESLDSIRRQPFDEILLKNSSDFEKASITPEAPHLGIGKYYMVRKEMKRQEGVSSNIYFPMNVEVTSSSGKKIDCRTYRQTANILDDCLIHDLPNERKPSAIYLKTILKGAKESGLPDEYQQYLKTIPHNGYEGEVDIGKHLNLN